MSLIVDINPVPWEILDLVRARILKNRANRQKRQPEKGKDLRRPMQVDNGILAKQRWEEPSFIGGPDRVFAIGFFAPIGDVIYPGFQLPVSYTVSVNGQTLGNLNFGLTLNRSQAYYFIWSPDENDKTEILSDLINPFDPFGNFSDIVITVIETEQPDPNTPIVIEISNILGVVNPFFTTDARFAYIFYLFFRAGFSFDKEFPGTNDGGRLEAWVNAGGGPDKLIFEYNDWK
jgi:hypothetical protein